MRCQTILPVSGLQASLSVPHPAAWANGGHGGIDEGERSRYFAGFLNASRRPAARRRPMSRSWRWSPGFTVVSGSLSGSRDPARGGSPTVPWCGLSRGVSGDTV